MKYHDLQLKISPSLFSILDVQKLFPDEKTASIQMQLSRFVKKGYLKQIKRGVYYFNDADLDEFQLSNSLYQPSYVSLESALFYYGIIPDITQQVTAITLTTSKKITNNLGTFLYSKIKNELYFGFTKIQAQNKTGYFTIAQKEKALLDYFYIRKIKSIEDLRLDISKINKKIYNEYVRYYPNWVQKINI